MTWADEQHEQPYASRNAHPLYLPWERAPREALRGYVWGVITGVAVSWGVWALWEWLVA